MAVPLACFCEGHGSTPDVKLCCGPIILSDPPPPASSPETGKGQGVSHGRSLTLWPRPARMPPLLRTLTLWVTTVTPAMTTQAKRKPWRPWQVLGSTGMTGWAQACRAAGVPLSRGDSGNSNTPHRASQVAMRAPCLPHLLWGLSSPGPYRARTTHGALREPRWRRCPSGLAQAKPALLGDKQPRKDTAGRPTSLSSAVLSRPFARRRQVCARGVTETRGTRRRPLSLSPRSSLASVSIMYLSRNPQGLGLSAGG